MYLITCNYKYKNIILLIHFFNLLKIQLLYRSCSLYYKDLKFKFKQKNNSFINLINLIKIRKFIKMKNKYFSLFFKEINLVNSKLLFRFR